MPQEFKNPGVYFLKISSQGDSSENKESGFVIRTSFSERGKPSWPDAFFFDNPYSREITDYSYSMLSRHVVIKVKKPSPANGLDKIYPNLTGAEVTAKIYLMQNTAKSFYFKVCDPSFYAVEKSQAEVASVSYKVDTMVRKGEFNWRGKDGKRVH